MKTFQQIIRESYNNSNINEFDNYIVEGLNINPISKTVSLTDSHNKGIDFSLINNPVYDNYKQYDVISIFKRTELYDIDNRQRDGNPFIYALKNKNGWKFNITNKEIYKYIKRFLEICHKIKSTYDTIIITPSTSDINERFMKVISKQVKSKNIINEFFTKTTIEEIVDDDLIDKYQIQKDYPNDFNKVIFEIHRSFRRMKGKFFEAKYVDKKYLKYIKYISLNNDENLRQYIDNKNILLLDDTISSGETISQCINGILSNFMPKSITIITLLSKLK
jgi:hypothetical protein